MTLRRITRPGIWEPRKILLLGGEDPGTVLLREILAKNASLTIAANLSEVLRGLAEDDYEVFLCDWRFAMGTWRDALEEVLYRCPQLPILVVCRDGGADELDAVVRAGAFDMLQAPYCERTVLAILEHALVSQEARTKGTERSVA